jgi:alpha-1,2-mannosyltransferase
MALFATFVLTSPLILLFIVPFLGSGVGWLLRRKTDGRRIHLVNLMNEEHRKYLEKRPESNSTTPDRLDAKGELQGTQDWEGVVGFFHPFWYDSPSQWPFAPHLLPSLDDFPIAFH